MFHHRLVAIILERSLVYLRNFDLLIDHWLKPSWSAMWPCLVLSRSPHLGAFGSWCIRFWQASMMLPLLTGQHSRVNKYWR